VPDLGRGVIVNSFSAVVHQHCADRVRAAAPQMTRNVYRRGFHRSPG
jgi:hypothetical protein